MSARPYTDAERRQIGVYLEDPMIYFGHPLTCNGGNPDFSTHHDHEVRMLVDDDGVLICPECGRRQQVPA